MTPEERDNFDFRLHTLERAILNNESVPDLMSRLKKIEDKLLPHMETMTSRFQALERLSNEFKNIESKVNSLNEAHANHSECMATHIIDLDKVSSGLQEVRNSLGALAVSHASDLTHIKNELTDCKGNQELNRSSAIAQIGNLKNDLESKLQDKPSKAEHDFIYNMLKVLVNDVSKKAEDHKKEFDGFKQRVSAEMAGMLDVTVSSSRHVKDHKEAMDTIATVVSQVTSLREANSVNLSMIKDKMSQAHQSMWEAISKPIDPNVAFKNEFDKKLETIALDSKNAALRSTNSQQQVTLLEKKIESINLQLKKYELNQ